MNTKLIILTGLAVVVTACNKPPVAIPTQPNETPQQVEATPFQGEVYRSRDGQTTLTLISKEECELRTRGTTLLCKYTKQPEALRVVATAFGTNQVLYFRFTGEGLQDNEGSLLLSPESYAKAMEQIRLAREQEERERRLAETQKMEAEKREQEALNKEKAAFISWITAYFAKGQKREGEYRANNFFRQQAHTFTLTMTRDPIVAVSGDKLRLEAFAKLHWHGKFRSYEDQDQIRIKAESLSLSDNPRGGWIDIVYIDPSGKEMVFERQNNGLIHDKAFVPNDFVLEPRTPER